MSVVPYKENRKILKIINPKSVNHKRNKNLRTKSFVFCVVNVNDEHTKRRFKRNLKG